MPGKRGDKSVCGHGYCMTARVLPGAFAWRGVIIEKEGRRALAPRGRKRAIRGVPDGT